MEDLVRIGEPTRRVVSALASAGGQPFVVGGGVRDAVLVRAEGGAPPPPRDVDVEVHGLGRARLLAALDPLGSVIERGESFAVVAVIVDGADVEVALPPSSSTGEELDVVAAAARRDFTINSMAWEPSTGRLVDPYGGASDLADRVLRHTSASFGDDPLRVLRAMQLAARFGLELAPETVEVARGLRPRFDEVARERVWPEWRKLARLGVDVTAGLHVLVDTGWIDLVPELDRTRGVEQDVRWHAEGDVFTHLGLSADAAALAAERDDLEPATREVVVLAALLHDLGKVSTTEHHREPDGSVRITSHGHARAGVPLADALLRRLGAPRQVVRRVLPLVDEHMTHVGVGEPSAAAVRRLMRRLDDGGHGPTIHEWARLVDADCAGRGPSAKESPARLWLDVAERLGPAPRRGILTGAHLVAAGHRPGPGFRDVLDAAVAAQDEGEFDDEEGAVRWLARRDAAGDGP